jgi:hypothetical protein
MVRRTRRWRSPSPRFDRYCQQIVMQSLGLGRRRVNIRKERKEVAWSTEQRSLRLRELRINRISDMPRATKVWG